MEQLKCKNCRAKIDPDEIAFGVVRCKYCGYTFTWLKKSVEQSVMIDLQMGEDELSACDFSRAHAAYKRAADADKTEPEAYFGMALAESKVQYLKDTVKDRLQPICHEVGGRKFSENANYKKALSLATPEQKIIYQSRAEEIDYIQAEFASLAQSGANYDCFICVKVTKDDGKHTEDSFAAGQLYQKLKEDGYHPFYSEEEIGNRRGADYEAMILYALYTSPCMLLVCFDEEYLKTKWVKNEYTRFAALRADDKEKKDEPKIALVYKNEEPRRLSGALGNVQSVNYDGAYAYSQICDFVSSFAGRTEEVRKRSNRKVLAIAASAVVTLGLVGGGVALALGKNSENPSGGEEQEPQNNVEYTLSADGDLTAVVLNGNKTVTIPEKINGIRVRSVKASAFGGNKEVETIVLPEGVTDLELNAFKDCSALKSLTLPSTVTTIGEDAFVNCSALTELVLPEGASYSEGLLSGCSALTSLTVSFKNIDSSFGAFFGADYYSGGVLTVQKSGSYYLPTSLKTVCVLGDELPESAFFRCSSLTTVTLSESVVRIGASVFQDCSALTSVEFSSVLTEVGETAFSGCSSLRSVTLPKTVTNVGDRAFADCSGLSKAEILGVPTLGETLFTGCGALTEMTLPFTAQALVEYFGTDEYDNSIAVQSITRATTYYLPSNLTKLTTVGAALVENSFANCAKISEITFDEALTTIGDHALANCAAITKASFENLQSVGQNAFLGCTSLSDVSFETLGAVGENAFLNCEALTRVTVSSADTWVGASFETPTSTPLYYAGELYVENGLLTELTLSDSVSEIPAYAFYNCTSLTTVNAGENLQRFGAQAFFGCESLQTVNVDSITAWSNAEFADETSNPIYLSGNISQNSQTLTELTVTNESISKYAFYGASCLKTLVIEESVTTLAPYSFNKLTQLTTLVLNAESLSDFTENNDVFTELCADSKNLVLKVGDNVQRIPAYLLSPVPESETYLSRVEFLGEPTVKEIGVKAFGITGKLTELTLPSSLENIGVGALSGCYALETLSLPFVGATKTQSATKADLFGAVFGEEAYQNGVKTQQFYAEEEVFYYVPASLKNLAVRSGQIPSGAFYGCSNLATVALHEGVTAIGQDTFYGCQNLTSVSGVNKVTAIERSAFDGCYKFSDFAAFSSVESIATYAFYGCIGLTELYFPDCLTSIAEGAFAACSSLQKLSVNFVGGAEQTEASKSSLFGYIFGDTPFENGIAIMQYFASGSENSASFYVPSGLTKVQVRGERVLYGAFMNCSMVEELELSDGLTEVGTQSFYQMTGLKKVTFPYVFENRFSSVFRSSVNEVHVTGGTLPYQAFYQVSGLQKAVIDEDVAIADDEYAYTFYQCSNLTEVNVPSSWTKLGGYAFYGCKNLESITLPDGLESMGKYIFQGCTLLKTVKIPAKVTGLLERAFSGCTSLESVDLSAANGILEIGAYAFSGCTSLKQLTLPDSVQTIGGSAFYGCTALTKTNVPESVISVGASAYWNTKSLEELVWAAENCADFNGYTHDTFLGLGVDSENGTTLRFTSTVKRVPSNMFNFSSSQTNLPKISKIIFDENSSVEEFGEYVIYNVIAELEEFRLPDSVFTMPQYGGSFYGFTIKNCYLPSLESWCRSYFRYIDGNIICDAENLYIEGELFTETSELVIPATVEEISSCAFSNVKYLRSLVVSEGVKEIGANAFSRCENLVKVTLPEGLEKIGSNAFNGAGYLNTLNVPSTLKTVGTDAFSYLSTSNMKVSITDLNAWSQINFSNTGANPLRLTNAQLLLNGNLVTAFAATGVEEIGSYAFYGYKNLESVSLPASVKKIGASAFQNCTALKNVSLSEGLTTIGSKAFYSCSALTGITLPETALNLGDSAFSGCGELTEITLPSELTNIPYGFLQSCTKLENVTLPQSLTSIGGSAFMNCSALESVKGTSSLQTVDAQAFSGCGVLSEFAFPESLETIGDKAFEGCSALTSIELGENVTSIGTNAFLNMSGLKTVVWKIPSLANLKWDSAIFEGAGTSSDMKLTFAENVQTIPSYLFCNRSVKSGLEIVIEGDSLTKINTEAFYGETVVSVTVPSLDAWYAIEFSDASANPLNSGAKLLVDGKTVTELNDLANVTLKKYAFSGYQYLEKISVEDSTVIGAYAFQNCENLASVYWNATGLPKDSLAGVGATNNNLTLTIGADVAEISDNYAKDMTGLYEVKFEEGTQVKKLGHHAFYGCSALEKFTAPDSLEFIDTSAFSDCTKLNNLVFGENVTKLAPYAFCRCTSLDNIEFKAKNIGNVDGTTFQDTPYRTNSLNQGVFYFYNKILDFDATKLEPNLVIPEGITGQYAVSFANQTVLETVTFPESYYVVMNRMFYNCGLTSVSFSSNLQIIGTESFYGSAFTEISFPESLAKINDSAFSNCANLERVNFVEGLTDIGANAFYNCPKLTSVVLPESLESVGNYAFGNCGTLASFEMKNPETELGENVFNGTEFKTSATVNGFLYIGTVLAWADASVVRGDVTVREGTTSIANSAFKSCSAVKTITLPSSLKKLGNNAFQYCTALTSVAFDGENSIEEIGSYAFYGCTQLTEFSLAEGIQKIEDYAFASCSSLASFEIPQSVTELGIGAFAGCTSLSELQLPEDLYWIGERALSNTGLTEIKIPTGVTGIDVEAFSLNKKLTKVNLPNALYTEYVDSYNRPKLNAAFTNCTALTDVTFDENMETLPNSIFYGCTALTAVSLPTGLTEIGQYAFYNCTALTDIGGIPKGVTTIGTYAFYGCSLLGGVEIPADLTLLGSYAFYNCDGLTEITLPSTLETVSSSAFYNCDNLTAVNFSEGLKTLESYAFWACAISEITLPSTLTSVGSYALGGNNFETIEIPSGLKYLNPNSFQGCRSLTEIVLPENITSIPEYAFASCTKLAKVTMKAVTYIDRYAFYNCTSLVDIDFGEKLTTIYSQAFNGCSGLKKLHFPKSLTRIYSNAFYNCNSLGGTNSITFEDPTGWQYYGVWWRDFDVHASSWDTYLKISGDSGLQKVVS